MISLRDALEKRFWGGDFSSQALSLKSIEIQLSRSAFYRGFFEWRLSSLDVSQLFRKSERLCFRYTRCYQAEIVKLIRFRNFHYKGFRRLICLTFYLFLETRYHLVPSMVTAIPSMILPMASPGPAMAHDTFFWALIVQWWSAMDFWFYEPVYWPSYLRPWSEKHDRHDMILPWSYHDYGETW